MGYRGKVEARNQAVDLRLAGWTMPEIAAELGVSRGSVSLWTRDVPYVPRRPRARRSGGPNRLQQAKADEIAELLEWGRAEVGELSDRDLLIAGTALYAGEGSKTDGKVVFANSDPRMISLFLRWLRTFFPIDETRLRLRLCLHEGLDLAEAEAFWAALTGIPTSQFQRPYRAVADPSIRTSKHPRGCPSVIYTCSRTHRTIMGLIGALLT